MTELDESLDLLDLEIDTDLDSLPEISPFDTPRPKKPWILLGVGLLVIILATYIIVTIINSDSGSSYNVNLDMPEVVTIDDANQGTDTLLVPDASVKPAVKLEPAAPIVKPEPVAPIVKPAPTVKPAAGTPAREIKDRQEVKFDPNKTSVKTPVKKAVPVQPKVAAGSWFVQFGSYSTHALAQNAQKQITTRHSGLFQGRQFVILAAVLPNGTTTYRLRIAFATSVDANGFCRNAKSDGLDCYIAK